MSRIAAVTSEYRNLPLAQLQESPTNPRRRFDERGPNELAESFKSQGVLQPLLVRVIGDEQYEVVAGARRLRAAKIAELNEVPARVVELSDAAVRKSQLTENLLREDVHQSTHRQNRVSKIKDQSTIRSTKPAVIHDFGGIRRSPRVCKSLKNLKRQDCHGRGRGFEPRRPRRSFQTT